MVRPPATPRVGGIYYATILKEGELQGEKVSSTNFHNKF